MHAEHGYQTAASGKAIMEILCLRLIAAGA